MSIVTPRTTLPVAEPKIPKSNRCVVCDKQITTITRYGEADAFCKSKCARSYFGTSLEVDVEMEEKSVLAKRIQARKR